MGEKGGIGLWVTPFSHNRSRHRNNQTIDWEGVKLPSRDYDTIRRGIWESIAIKKTGVPVMNHDGGFH